ncbi:MAG: hypothetical protein ACI9WU_002470 [Myxococcota bacterium]
MPPPSEVDAGPVAAGPCAEVAEGGPCDDGNACTQGDFCQDGFCVFETPVNCDPPAGGACLVASCDPVDGCHQSVAAEGTQCDVACFDEGLCLGGQCLPVQSSAIQCPAPLDPCVAALGCAADTGECTVPQYALACPQGSVCQAQNDGAGPLTCVATFGTLCMPCRMEADCADPLFPSAVHRCIDTGGAGAFCASDCSSLDCPEGFICTEQGCRATEGECVCDPDWASMGLTTDCVQTSAFGTCSGQRGCAPGGLTACDAPVPSAETCDGFDNDCNGQVDEVQGGCGADGACCLDNGCQVLPETSCQAAGGAHQGPGISCAESACVVGAQGGCCQAQVCSANDVTSCIGGGGVYHGDGITCQTLDCSAPVPTGGCCFAGGSCADLPAISCAQQQGVFFGLGSLCAEQACPSLGACCVAATTCAVTEQPACAGQSGSWASSLSCSDVDCLLDTGAGACCLAGGSCAVLEPTACTDLDGLFLKNEQCVGQCPGDAVGACCDPGGACGVLADSECFAPSQWQGLDTDCGDCIQPDGACCTDSGCFVFTEAQCGIAGGTWTAAGLACDGACP